MVTYLEDTYPNAKVYRTEDCPPNRNVMGYGCKIPLAYKVDIGDKRQRRVYCICYSNAGSAYVLVKGARLYLKWSHYD